MIHFGLAQVSLEGESPMLRDRYDHMDIFALVMALSLAMEPVLAQLEQLLDDDVFFSRSKPICAGGCLTQPPVGALIRGRGTRR
jgi:hypothetical protein